MLVYTSDYPNWRVVVLIEICEADRTVKLVLFVSLFFGAFSISGRRDKMRATEIVHFYWFVYSDILFQFAF